MIILLTGLKGSGKSTVADYLVKDRGFTRVKMAGPLKDMLRAIGLTEDHLEGELKEEPLDMLGGHTPRWAMQSLGLEWGRNCLHKDLWVDLAVGRAKEIVAKGASIVIDDMRFNNELRSLKSAFPDSISARVRRSDTKIDGPEEIQALHGSEKEIVRLPVDAIISNDAGISELIVTACLTLGLPLETKKTRSKKATDEKSISNS